MTILAIIVLILLGLLLLLLEFAVVPGVTIAGIGGFLLLAYSVYLAFAQYGTLAGFITLVIVLVAAPALIYYLFRSRAGRKMILETNIDAKVDTTETENIQPGDAGITIGRLAPMGKVRVNGVSVEAQSTGSFIDQNKPVRVLKVYPGKIIVELIKSE
ncbi:MAG: NfeD family protein [Bacteroidota bacterium]